MSIWAGDIHVGTGLQLPTYKATMETESVKSGHSEHSSRSPRRAHGSHRGSSNNHHHHHHSHRSRSSKHSNHSVGNRSECSYSTALTNKCASRNERSEGGEVIEVQILSQDDNWGDNTTAITGNTSEHSVSVDNMAKIGKDYEHGLAFQCQMWMGSVVAGVLSACAFLSPIVMVILPKIETLDWEVKKCGPECDGLLISLSFKLLILLIGTWAVFLRRPKATMPRIFIFRAIILSLVFVFTFAYWLFYGVRIVEKRHDDYHSIVLFAVSLVDALLFIHYLAIILMEVRQLQPQYFIKVVRSPDGESHCYNIGQLSIQRAAVWILERYYQDFSIYNPYLDTIPTKSCKATSGFKVYEVDGINNSALSSRSHSMAAGDGRRRDTSHNERFYEEHEYERRVRKRRARLITAAEEAFTHIKRLQDEQGKMMILLY